MLTEHERDRELYKLSLLEVKRNNIRRQSMLAAELLSVAEDITRLPPAVLSRDEVQRFVHVLGNCCTNLRMESKLNHVHEKAL